MPTERPIGRLSILGLGLMGGSLARAVSALEVAERVTGWSPESTERDAALTTGAVGFAAASWRQAVSDADLVVLAMPLQACVRLLRDVGDAAPAHATLTDLASLNAPLARVASQCGLDHRWVGGHPMAGGELSGFWASRADLFEGATVWISPASREPEAEARVRAVERMWAAVGGQPRRIEAREHDRMMALVSHLPQLTSNALAEALQGAGIDRARLGPGGRDMTRLSGSSPEMWGELLQHASPELIAGLRMLGDAAVRLADALEAGDVGSVTALMRRTKAWKGRG